MHYPWQHHDWQRLAASFAQLPNAWLFTGPSGIGKSEFAQQVARALLCEAPQPDHHGCGQCLGCRWFDAGNHPDYRHLRPAQEEDDDDGKDGKAVRRKLPQIKIDGVRDVIAFAHLSSHRGGRRVIVVEPAESLNPAAANALLKVLEEPPAEVVFLLVADAPQRLLPTIKSRCRQFPLTAPDAALAADWLQQQGLADAAAELAFHGGRPVFEHDEALTALRRDFVRSLTQLGMGGVLAACDKLDKHKLPLALPLEWLAKWLHDLASLKLAGQLRYYPDMREAMTALLPRLDPHQLMRCQRELEQLTPFGQHTLVTRLQLEALLMHYLRVFSGKNP